MAKPVLDDDLWMPTDPVLPPPKPSRLRYRGRRPINSEPLTGILFMMRTGIAWDLLPQEMRCGSCVACWRRLHDWQAAGVWQKVREGMLDELRRAEELGQTILGVDSGSVHAVGAGEQRKRTPRIGASRTASIISRASPRARTAPMRGF